MKFKIGDELIILKDLTDRELFGKEGERFIVTDVYSSHYWGDSIRILMAEEEVELAAIFDSPLYKALL